jgi:hypothetical protein
MNPGAQGTVEKVGLQRPRFAVVLEHHELAARPAAGSRPPLDHWAEPALERGRPKGEIG